MAEIATRKATKRGDSAVNQLKIPPHSLEAEQSVLGGLMIDSQAWDRVADRLVAEDFFERKNQLIFNIMYRLAEKNEPFDVLTVAEALKSVGELDNVGGEVYLFELASNTPSAANIAAYADIVSERATLRKLVSVGGEIADLAYHPLGRSSKEIVDEAESKVFQIAEQKTRGSGPVALNKVVATAAERIDTLYHSDGDLTGAPTGFVDLDHMTTGLQPGDMFIVAGRPSMGKTLLAMNMAEAVASKSKLPVLVFSLEMPAEQLAMRMMSALGRIEQNRVRTGKLNDADWPRLTSAISILSEMPIFIDDTPGLSPSEMRARARRLAREHGQLGLIVIDYLQLMVVPGMRDNRVLEVSEISRSLKALAKELSVPVIALSQLNRSLEQRQDRRPVMSDLRESGSIEQDADVIAFIYRDEVYHPDTTEKGIAEIIIAKQRNGPTGVVKLTFLGQYARFENYSPPPMTGPPSGPPAPTMGSPNDPPPFGGGPM